MNIHEKVSELMGTPGKDRPFLSNEYVSERDKVVLVYINQHHPNQRPTIDVWGQNCTNVRLSKMRKDYPDAKIKRCKLSEVSKLDDELKQKLGFNGNQ